MSDLPINRFKAGLAAGRVQRGIWCTIGDALVAEMLAGCGYDWLMFDTEHSAIDPLTVLPLLQAVAPYPVAPIVRPSALNPVEIKKLLDLGAQTLLIPYVQSAEEARLAVASVTYPPQGIRGVSGLTRATRFATVAGYAKRARDEICLIVQIETEAALAELEAIAGVEGVDAVFIGPADLAASMGHVGEPSHPRVKAAVLEAIARITALGKPAGLLTADAALYEEALAAGALFASKNIDMAALKRGLV